MTLLVSFFSGLFAGIPFGAIFSIPRYGKVIVLALGCLIGIYVIVEPTMLPEYVRSISGYSGLANLVGIFIGQFFGRFALLSAIEEWGS